MWKFLAVSAMSVMFGMWVQVLRTPTETVNEKILTIQISELHQQIDGQTAEIAALRQSVAQLSVDTAQIAEKVGVTAHPVTAPLVRIPQ